MMNSDARTVRGLSIAVLVLSILTIVGSLFALAFLGIGGAALSDPDFVDSTMLELNTDADLQEYNLNSGDVMGLAMMSLGVMSMIIGWCILCSIVTLIASILGMRNCGNPNKLGSAFGWAIAGAVFAFLTGRIVTMALLIVSAVYLNKLSRGTTIPYGQPQPGYGHAANYAQPQQPYGQALYGQQPVYGQPAQQAPVAGQTASPEVLQQPTPPAPPEQK